MIDKINDLQSLFEKLTEFYENTDNFHRKNNTASRWYNIIAIIIGFALAGITNYYALKADINSNKNSIKSNTEKIEIINKDKADKSELNGIEKRLDKLENKILYND